MRKFLPYILIFFILVGFFSPAAKVNAQTVPPPPPTQPATPPEKTPQEKADEAAKELVKAAEKADATARAAEGLSTDTAFEQELNTCSIWRAGSWGMCIALIFYWTYFQLPAMILWVAAWFFNAMINLGIDSALTRASGFIPAAWAVVRDISNIFFILVLLYIAIKTILNLGGHEVKKMIVHVVIMALLINFSMFFTKVVIDSSNILALVFYNKLKVNPITPTDPSRPKEEKDIAGEMWKTFDATRLINGETIEALKNQPVLVDGKMVPTNEKYLPFSFTIGMIVISGSIMLWAAYAFFIAGIMFIGRLIELWILIIFSPFAFMSWTIPKFAGIEYLGWDAWLKRLISTSFMAPIFMFFMYLIFMLLPHIGKFNKGVLGADGKPVLTTLGIILGILIPALVIMAMLLKATHFAKKGGGQFGEMVLGGAKLVAGLAVGGAALGGAVVGRTLIARTAAKASTRPDAMAHGKATFEYKKWEHGGRVGAPPIVPPKPTSLMGQLGSKINENQWKSGDVAHARHEMDEIKKKIGVEGLDDKYLSGVDKERMKTAYTKDKRSEIESEIRKGYDAKGKPVVIERDINGNTINATGENDYKAKRRQDIISEVKIADPNSIDGAGNLNDQGQKKVEDRLNTEFNERLRELAKVLGEAKYSELQHEAQEKVGMGTRVMARSTSGTYDARNLANIKADKREGLSTKATVGLITAVALGIRAGLKQGGVQHGTPQGDFIKDLKDTIGGALKNVKINVSAGSGGGSSHAEAKVDHGTSGGGHH